MNGDFLRIEIFFALACVSDGSLRDGIDWEFRWKVMASSVSYKQLGAAEPDETEGMIYPCFEGFDKVLALPSSPSPGQRVDIPQSRPPTQFEVRRRNSGWGRGKGKDDNPETRLARRDAQDYGVQAAVIKFICTLFFFP